MPAISSSHPIRVCVGRTLIRCAKGGLQSKCGQATYSTLLPKEVFYDVESQPYADREANFAGYI